ncbi:fimbrillin family protein [uncultured Bacteroides sp.]|uniref:fimbrillin family protein n=1 Tax=uncultured Bacteroides sp. TaxID=162156 RepID=UPI0025D75319|nr:fimbrillin family protein [uncultured Bacteroides sp.]
MKIKGFYILGMAVSVLAGCSSEENADMLFSSDANTLKIGTYIAQGTRASNKNTFVNGDAFGLYACQTTGDYANAYTANYMDNVVVTKGESGWTYAPLSSWPTDANEHLSFIAFYPQSAKSTALTYPFTIGVDEKGEQIAPMCCTVKDASVNDRNGTAINGNESDASFTPNSGSLNLKFKHILSKVRVKVKLDREYPGISVNLNSLSLNDIFTGGTYTVAADLASGTWGSLLNKTILTLKSGTEDVVAINTQETEFCDTLMIPQTVSDTPAYLTLSYTHTLTEGGDRTITKSIYLPGGWEQNKIYNYVVNLSLDVNNITISADINSMEDTTDPVIGDKPAEAVDLGLSVKWASYDYGAMSPYDVSPKFKFSDASLPSGGGNGAYYTLTEPQDRASKWGSNWSTPTQEQWKELIDNCTITEITENGIKGYLIEAKNKNKIFLSNDCYWTSYYYSQYSSYYGVRYSFYYYDLPTKTLKVTENATYRLRPVFK